MSTHEPHRSATPAVGLALTLLALALGVFLLTGETLSVELPLVGPLGPLSLYAAGGLQGTFLLLLGLLGTAAVLAGRRDGLDRVGRSLVVVFLGGLLLVPLAADVFTFLLAWELMSAAPGLLLALSPRPETRRAGLVYLVYAHLSALALMAGLLTWNQAGDGSFDGLLARPAPAPATVLLLLAALIKAGVMPFHRWLPEAHPAAPGHVSALMSGAMVAQPAYVVLRFLAPGGTSVPLATIVLLLGALTSALASLHALHERDLKRLLALTTVAHMGVVFAVLGLLLERHGPLVPYRPYLEGAVLVYVLAHGLAKGALFLVAGEIHHATGELDLERLGGLWRSSRGLALMAGLGGIALAGLPPFAGFAAEIVVFTCLFATLGALGPLNGVVLLGAVFLLGIGAGAGLAAIGKFVLGAFHGPARAPIQVHPVPRTALLGPALALAASLVVGVAPGLVAASFDGLAADAWSLPTPVGDIRLAPLLVLGGILTLAAVWALRGTRAKAVVPWATGGPPPTPRQTYTPQALVMPYRILFAEILRPSSDLRLQDAPIAPFAPSHGHYEDPTPRYIEPWIHRPLLRLLLPPVERLRRLHRGPVQSYLIIALLVLVLLLFLLPVMR